MYLDAIIVLVVCLSKKGNKTEADNEQTPKKAKIMKTTKAMKTMKIKGKNFKKTWVNG